VREQGDPTAILKSGVRGGGGFFSRGEIGGSERGLGARGLQAGRGEARTGVAGVA
jgi:hypothetical protein